MAVDPHHAAAREAGGPQMAAQLTLKELLVVLLLYLPKLVATATCHLIMHTADGCAADPQGAPGIIITIIVIIIITNITNISVIISIIIITICIYRLYYDNNCRG